MFLIQLRWPTAATLAVLGLGMAWEADRINAEEPGNIAARAEADPPAGVPQRLELTGRTAYDINTITKVRPRFNTRVEKVYAVPGQKVEKGDPLFDLLSTDLAAARSDFQTRYVQWQHDLKLYNLRKKLVETGAISQELWLDTQNNEQKSRLDHDIARDKLHAFYEITDDEITALIQAIGEKAAGPEKSRMTLRSRSDGRVIECEAVTGKFYQTTDVLMEIAPRDHLWVWATVNGPEQEKVRVGQALEVQVPWRSRSVRAQVDAVTSTVSNGHRTVKVRGTISDPGGHLAPDMLLRMFVDLVP